MPSSILHDFLRDALCGVMELVCYFVGRIIAPAISLGRWNCDRITADTPRRKIRAAGLYHVRDRQVYLPVEATELVGLLTILLAVGSGVLIWCLNRG